MSQASRKALLTLLALLLVSSGLCLADAQAQDAGGKARGRSIDFEDELVEGVNKRPYDSLSQVSEKEKRRKKPHLYRKRTEFRMENEETLREVRFVQ